MYRDHLWPLFIQSGPNRFTCWQRDNFTCTDDIKWQTLNKEQIVWKIQSDGKNCQMVEILGWAKSNMIWDLSLKKWYPTPDINTESVWIHQKPWMCDETELLGVITISGCLRLKGNPIRNDALRSPRLIGVASNTMFTLSDIVGRLWSSNEDVSRDLSYLDQTPL